MNKKIKKLWVNALRSGKYKQGRGRLKHSNQYGSKYCCLGVLSDLAVKAGVCSVKKVFGLNENNLQLLHKPVMKWAGLRREDPKVRANPRGYGRYNYALSHLNDEEDFTFEQIANAIEKQL